MIRAEVGACFGRSFEMARIDVEVVARIFPRRRISRRKRKDSCWQVWHFPRDFRDTSE